MSRLYCHPFSLFRVPRAAPCTLCPLLRPYQLDSLPGGMFGPVQQACQDAQLGIPETAHGPTLEYRQLPLTHFHAVEKNPNRPNRNKQIHCVCVPSRAGKEKFPGFTITYALMEKLVRDFTVLALNFKDLLQPFTDPC
jgi:hypothetical protein